MASQKLYGGLWADVRLGEGAAEAPRDGEHLEEEPLVVLSAGDPDAMNVPPDGRRAFTAMNERMALGLLSSRGEHRVVQGADHLSIVAEKRYAGEVIDAVRGWSKNPEPVDGGGLPARPSLRRPKARARRYSSSPLATSWTFPPT